MASSVYVGGVALPAGSVTAPSLSFAAQPTTGFYQHAAGFIDAAIASIARMYISSSEFILGTAIVNGWSNNADVSQGGTDTALSRISSGVVGVGTGAAGSFAGGLKLTSLTLAQAAPLLTTSVALTDGAAAQTGTLTNAPAAGNPTKWIAINDNGTTRQIPAW